jgi:SAM-dependent methyltransferase
MDVHPIAAAGFGSAADAYERGRPEYPSAAIHWLARRVGLRAGVTVVDLAAGTGKLSRPLAATGARVIAVEPVEAMRRAIGPGVETVEGTAEAIQLPDGSAGVVTVGQAFHWFDGDAALAEIHRVLRPGGALALVWNRRRMDHPLNQAVEELIAPYRGHTPALRTNAWRAAFERTELFGPLEEHTFPNEQSLDADGLADRVASISFIASLDETARADVLRTVRALAGDGRVTIPHDTEVHLSERLG